ARRACASARSIGESLVGPVITGKIAENGVGQKRRGSSAMRFSFSAEQEEFRGTLRRALEARSPTKEVRRLMATDTGFDRDGWKRLNQELGLTGLHIPEAYGG